ncbi:peptidoglycan-binding protein [Bacillus atrophaeus]|nr:peptidoglycan-binding protein [Bacillus atrophaeus]MCY9114643.1 peptidoglycan-binding protein [Bacillus atrophaeus]MEC0924139.1 peptidoglycan-binding protein [Bacillus atrophaeus]MEC0932750.1 peptidoglycan-binding protein [Bacillus atrophaeus]
MYGPKTANAVKRFQLMNGLSAEDGIYGPDTKEKLEAKLK